MRLPRFSTHMDWAMGRMVEDSGCGVSFGDLRVTNLDFADDAVTFAKTLGRVAAWRMAIRRPKEYRSKVDAAMRCRGACSH